MSKTTTPQQYEKLADLMASRADIACGYHQRAKEEVAVFWEEVTGVLNALGPPTKNASAWKKVWIDWKCYIKKKMSANKREMMSTGGGPCRLQRINPLEEKVVQLTGLVTSTSGICGAIDCGVACEIQELENSEMDISARCEDLPTTSKKRQRPKETTLGLFMDLLKSQKEFHQDTKEFNNTMAKKYEEMSTHLRRMNRSLEKMAEIAGQQLKEEQRHNRVKEELLKKKVDIKLRMFQLEYPDHTD